MNLDAVKREHPTAPWDEWAAAAQERVEAGLGMRREQGADVWEHYRVTEEQERAYAASYVATQFSKWQRRQAA